MGGGAEGLRGVGKRFFIGIEQLGSGWAGLVLWVRWLGVELDGGEEGKGRFGGEDLYLFEMVG